MAISVVVLAGADRVQRVIGEHGVLALERLMGLVLTALAVEMLLSGIRTFVTSAAGLTERPARSLASVLRPPCPIGPADDTPTIRTPTPAGAAGPRHRLRRGSDLPPTAGDAASPATVDVRVWEWPVRAFHWTIVALLVALVVTAKLGGNWIDWHMRAGYAMLALVVFRVLWGFFGGPHARFFSFVRGPGRGAALRALDGARARRNGTSGTTRWAAGASCCCCSRCSRRPSRGCSRTTTSPARDRWPGSSPGTCRRSITWFHRRHVWWIYALVAVHVTAVFTYLVAFRENLIRAMVTGRKRLPASAAPPPSTAR